MPATTHCPMYIDYVRECIFQINSLTEEIDTTVQFCISGRYEECPFYRYIIDPTDKCELFKQCNLCNHYKIKRLDEFVEMANTWCLGNYTDCARHKAHQAGQIPVDTLHPAGHHLPA